MVSDSMNEGLADKSLFFPYFLEEIWRVLVDLGMAFVFDWLVTEEEVEAEVVAGL